MKEIIAEILEHQEVLKRELFEIFSDLDLDYSLIEKTENIYENDLKALNNTKYRFYHKGYGLITIKDCKHGYVGYTFDCSYQMKYSDKSNAFVEFEASIDENKKVYCIDIKKINTCHEVDIVKNNESKSA